MQPPSYLNIVKEYIKIKVNGNSYDHLCEQMDEFVTEFQKANTHRHYSSVQWTWEKAGEDKEELVGASNSELLSIFSFAKISL